MLFAKSHLLGFRLGKAEPESEDATTEIFGGVVQGALKSATERSVGQAFALYGRSWSTRTRSSSHSSNVVSYNVHRANGIRTSYSQIASGVVNLMYDDTSVTEGSTYTYAVNAVDNEGNESTYSNAVTVSVP